MFYVNDKPEGNFLYTETIKLYCMVLYCYFLSDSDKSNSLCPQYGLHLGADNVVRAIEVEAQQNLAPVLAVGGGADGLHTLTCPPDGAVGARPVIIIITIIKRLSLIHI